MAERIGYCGLDAARAPLRGDEQRPCWQEREAAMPAGSIFEVVAEARR
ncbi:MAG TPA: hypothetical protein VFK38_02390 [Candidatus Limnocylindrales bacterium]|nr:hypothetical protein [Candidatus Limnocylindrales bacterium]